MKNTILTPHGILPRESMTPAQDEYFGTQYANYVDRLTVDIDKFSAGAELARRDRGINERGLGERIGALSLAAHKEIADALTSAATKPLADLKKAKLELDRRLVLGRDTWRRLQKGDEPIDRPEPFTSSNQVARLQEIRQALLRTDPALAAAALTSAAADAEEGGETLFAIQEAPALIRAQLTEHTKVNDAAMQDLVRLFLAGRYPTKAAEAVTIKGVLVKLTSAAGTAGNAIEKAAGAQIVNAAELITKAQEPIGKAIQ